MKTSQKLLLCAASGLELSGVEAIRTMRGSLVQGVPYGISDRMDVLITGVGIFQATYNVAKALGNPQKKYQMAIGAGIAGAYDTQCVTGTAYVGGEFAFADCATENPDGSMNPLVGSQFLDGDAYPFSHGLIKSPVAGQIASALGIECARVNTVSRIITDPKHIAMVTDRFPAELETMESAAIAYACAMEHVPYAEIRCVSNHTVPKSEGKWDIAGAVGNLGTLLERLLNDNCKLLSEYLG